MRGAGHFGQPVQCSLLYIGHTKYLLKIFVLFFACVRFYNKSGKLCEALFTLHCRKNHFFRVSDSSKERKKCFFFGKITQNYPCYVIINYYVNNPYLKHLLRTTKHNYMLIIWNQLNFTVNCMQLKSSWFCIHQLQYKN